MEGRQGGQLPYRHRFSATDRCVWESVHCSSIAVECAHPGRAKSPIDILLPGGNAVEKV
jgi:hypothetical protein